MKYYSVAEMEITDRGSVPEYLENVTRMVEQCGGRFLAPSRVDKIEGHREVSQFSLIVEWPSQETAEVFYSSEEYRPCRERSVAGAKSEFLLVAGEDVSKTARIAG